MEIKKRGRKPINEKPMTQSERYQRYKSNRQRQGDPTSYEMRTITYAALKKSWTGVSYIAQLDIYGAVEKEAVERGLDPGAVVERFKEAMTQ